MAGGGDTARPRTRRGGEGREGEGAHPPGHDSEQRQDRGRQRALLRTRGGRALGPGLRLPAAAPPRPPPGPAPHGGARASAGARGGQGRGRSCVSRVMRRRGEEVGGLDHKMPAAPAPGPARRRPRRAPEARSRTSLGRAVPAPPRAPRSPAPSSPSSFALLLPSSDGGLKPLLEAQGSGALTTAGGGGRGRKEAPRPLRDCCCHARGRGLLRPPPSQARTGLQPAPWAS